MCPPLFQLPFGMAQAQGSKSRSKGGHMARPYEGGFATAIPRSTRHPLQLALQTPSRPKNAFFAV